MPTVRGWACIAAAGALLGAGAALRIPELLEIGVALLALVVVQLGRMRLRACAYTSRRTILPPRGVAGSPLTIEVAITASRRPQDALLYADPLPASLGGVRRLPLTDDDRTREMVVRYTLTPARRGRYSIGPGQIAATDPFGVVRSSDPTGVASTFVVFPRIEALRGRAPAGTRNAGSSTAATASLAAGSEFYATREWRPGDDMRRIHWRTTARLGKVMVRQEELPKRDRATVVLDNRFSSYDAGWEGAEAFERAVEAAASLVHHFLGEGYAVRLATTAASGDVTFGKGPAHHGLLMTALATAALIETGAPLQHLQHLAMLEAGGSGTGADAGFVIVVGGVPEANEGGRLIPVLQEADSLVVLTGAHPDPGRALARAGIPMLLLPPGRTLSSAWNGSFGTRGRGRPGARTMAPRSAP